MNDIVETLWASLAFDNQVAPEIDCIEFSKESVPIDIAAANGLRIIPVEEFHARGVADVMAEARDIVGSEPCYVSYDIDFVDPTFAPGTGTPEVGGPNSYQALQVVRELEGLQIAGADLVEVSPPFDASGGTAFLGVTIMFELLCAMIGAQKAAG